MIKNALDEGRFQQKNRNISGFTEESTITEQAHAAREPAYEILPLFYERWSPRAMNGKKLEENELFRLFESARWAPSTYNEQEWRFLYANNNSPQWHLFFDALLEANQIWCKNASTLVLIAGKETMTQNGKNNPVHSFDCGASFQNIALQGISMGLVIHGMAGFSSDKIKENLSIPDGYHPEAMFAIGHPAEKEILPENSQDKEKPSGRKPIEEFICEGKFNFG